MKPVLRILSRLGHATIGGVERLGFAARFFSAILRQSGTSVVRPQLVIKEIYQAGVLSLIIVLMSGMFIGMVLALQGYETLVRFGATESMGVLVALSLVRELGPVVAALLFACAEFARLEGQIQVLGKRAGERGDGVVDVNRPA